MSFHWEPFFKTGTETGVVLQTASGSYTTKGHFRNEFASRAIAGINYQGTNPILLVPSVAVEDAGLIKGDTVLISGENKGEPFEVREEPQTDGIGKTLLILGR